MPAYRRIWPGQCLENACTNKVVPMLYKAWRKMSYTIFMDWALTYTKFNSDWTVLVKTRAVFLFSGKGGNHEEVLMKIQMGSGTQRRDLWTALWLGWAVRFWKRDRGSLPKISLGIVCQIRMSMGKVHLAKMSMTAALHFRSLPGLLSNFPPLPLTHPGSHKYSSYHEKNTRVI